MFKKGSTATEWAGGENAAGAGDVIVVAAAGAAGSAAPAGE